MDMLKAKLQFKEKDIHAIAARYQYQAGEKKLASLKPFVRQRGFITKDELHEIAYWKAPRIAVHVEKNSKKYVSEVTRFALSTPEERARIEVLTCLNSVSWPTASVMLHFFHVDPYPILDFRALESIGVEVPSQYTFDFWWQYVKFCRAVARKNRVRMRTLDKALWQFSKEKQV
ncbi:DUF2459 domain-containing protein [bacterium]|nr:DUF2459 domain-containing protein [bacterium]